MILISGDLHLNSQGEASLITKANLIKTYGEELYANIKYNLVLGDGGWKWSKASDRTDKHLLTFLGEKHRGFKTLCLFGNHENYNRILKCPLVDIGIGNLVYQVWDEDIYYLQRGKIYNIDGKKILALGGALSVDKLWRTEDISWWPQEYWSFQESKDCLDLIEKDNDFDYICAHTGPNKINQIVFASMFDASHGGDKFRDSVALFQDIVDEKTKCKAWLMGHFHEDQYYTDLEKEYHYFYKLTKLI
jgi:hypothetical protein